MGYTYFFITWNNYTPEQLERLRKEAEEECIYGMAYREKESQEHLHSIIIYGSAVRFKKVNEKFYGSHVVLVNNIAACKAYCEKDGERLFEFGKLPMSKKEQGKLGKEVYVDILALANEGKIMEIKEKYPAIFFHNYKKIANFLKFKDDILNHVLNEVNIWLYGVAGTGKSSEAFKMAPNAYLKNMNKWWDGYADEDDVIVDDVDPDCMKYMVWHLKQWGDRYPFSAEVKGGIIKIRPRRIIVTSNYRIEDCVSLHDQESILRRFKQVHYVQLGHFDMIRPEKKAKLETYVDDLGILSARPVQS